MKILDTNSINLTESEKNNTYTVQFFKDDLRTKKGYKLVKKLDVLLFAGETPEDLNSEFEENNKTWLNIQKTFIERTHYFSKEKFLERYDTPYYCSPSSESYWSM